MKKALTLLFIGVSMAIPAIGQSEIDTLYYDKDWKGVENKAFATYFRIIPTSTDSNFRKQFRDYYITGELQSEGGFITIDRYDDSKSFMDKYRIKRKFFMIWRFPYDLMWYPYWKIEKLLK